MKEDEEHLDELLSEFLWDCRQLKMKAEAVKKEKKSLPAWAINLLKDNKPSQN